MTWEEIDRKYEQNIREERPRKRLPKLEKNWDSLLRSTDKLVWLFSLSSGGKLQYKK